MKGKLLNDEDQVDKLKINNNGIVQAFIGPVPTNSPDLTEANIIPNQSLQEVTSNTPGTDILGFTDQLAGSRGFDYFKANGYTVIYHKIFYKKN